jgi:NAD(P)-dependent dehydrogenase (short-subunit alcohol dehydrogenase family)
MRQESALDETTIIVTGAAGSLGTALSMKAASAGLNTVMLDCDQKGLDSAYDRITSAGLPEPALYPLDLAGAGPEHYEELLSTVAGEFGGLNAIVHCAARFGGLTPLEQFSPAEWLMHMQVNLNAAWLLSAQALPMLRDSGAGRLYFMLEDMARVEGAFWGAYGVSKHAIKALVSQLAAENSSSGVQVLGINPGPMRSQLRSSAYHSENPALQPDPEPVAQRIMELLSGAVTPGGNFVDLMSD